MKNDNYFVPTPPRLLQTLLGVFFKLLYHSFAWSYDVVASIVSLGNWNTWVKSVTNIINGQKILELGFGTGHLQVELLKRGYEVFGLDESRQMNRITLRRILRSQSLINSDNLRLIQANGQYLPVTSNSFDTIVATFPTEYVFQTSTLSEIHRVLKPQGELVILASVWITGKSIPERALALLFQLTGQSPPIDTRFSPFLERLNKCNFEGECLWLEDHRSRLLFFRARKP